MKKRLLVTILGLISMTVRGQLNPTDSITMLFNKQLVSFAQEKIYLHTDKPYYISGEKIWFRAHLVEAICHIPSPVSRYVFVELINPLDSVITRVKIRQEAEAYHGYLLIPEDAPEGDYTIRAYTTYMRSLDENYLSARTIRINDPQTKTIYAETSFQFESDRLVYATFRFSNINTSEPLIPQSVGVSVNGGRTMNIEVADDGTSGFNFETPAAMSNNTILLEVFSGRNPYRQFIRVPTPDDDFDVSFYPEGGSLLQNASCAIAFKAMKSNGQATEVSGVVYDRSGVEIVRFESEHLGMGCFSLLAEKGKTYYAVCENDKGQSKRYELPNAVEQGYSLAVNSLKDRFYVSVLRPAASIDESENAQMGEKLYLLAHTRGMIHFAMPFDVEQSIVFNRELFPSGVLHLILFDAGLMPVSERLMFINNPDQAKVTFSQDKDNYETRSLVKNKVIVTDSDGDPISGNFSVAVTSDLEVTIDTASNILTYLLLSSDLRGTIENPVYYFQNTPSSVRALDLLMRTQGWRRYDLAEMAQGHFLMPTFPIELGPEMSGTVQSLLLNKPVGNIDVTVMSMKNDYFETTKTDADGRFHFYGGELADSTGLIVSAIPRRGFTQIYLTIDEETFPAKTLSTAPPAELDRMLFAKYVDKAEQQFQSEGGIRLIELPDISITAQQQQRTKPPIKSPFYTLPLGDFLTEEEILEVHATRVSDLLVRIPGVSVIYDNGVETVTIRKGAPLFLIDNMPVEPNEFLAMNVELVAQIDVLKNPSQSAIFGRSAYNGVIALHTRVGGPRMKEKPLYHIQWLLPLGYQQPVEFYAPKYDTPEKRNTRTPDYRTTIYWQPVVQTDNQGVASFEFYTSDEQASYSIIIEGLDVDGKIIQKEEKIQVTK